MRTLNPIISMISGFSDVSLSPKTIYFYIWRDQNPPNNSSKIPNRFGKLYVFAISTVWISIILEMLEKAGAEHHEDPSNCFRKSCMRDQSVTENMKWELKICDD